MRILWLLMDLFNGMPVILQRFSLLMDSFIKKATTFCLLIVFGSEENICNDYWSV